MPTGRSQARTCTRALSICALALGVLACGASRRERVQAEISPTAQIAIAALRALPVDSLCAETCRVVALDPRVKRASSAAPAAIQNLPVIAELGEPEAASISWRIPMVRRPFQDFSRDADTIRVGIAVLIPKGTSSTATAIVGVIEPMSIGAFAIVALRFRAGSWKVEEVRYFEG